MRGTRPGIAAAAFAALTCMHAYAADTLDTVIVYAQKRAAPLVDVPMGVTTLSDQELAAAGLDDLDALALHAPVFDLQRSVGAATTTLRIRRIGTLGNVPTLEPAVGLFVDGAYRQRSFLAADLLDIGRVEILAGPQSTLYGRNVSAGVVALYTREPPAQLQAWGEVTGGALDVAHSPGIFDVKAGVGGPLSPTVSASVAGAYSRHGHTLFNALPGMPDGDDRSRWTWRGQALWDGESLRLRLLAGYSQEADDQGESDVYLAPGSRSATIAAALAQRGLAPVCPDNIPDNRRTCSVATNHLDLDALDLTLIADISLDNGWTLTSTTAWDKYDARRVEDDAVQLFAPILYFHDLQQGDAVQEELRVATPVAARTSLLAGVFYYRNTFERGALGAEPTFGPNGALAFDALWPVPFALPDQHGVHDSRTRAEYWSAFAEMTWKIARRLDLITGVRWHEDDKEASIANSVTQPGASIVANVLTPATSPTGAPVNGKVDRSSTALTWSATPRYRVNDHLMMYATVARGSKPGGFNNGTGNAPLAAREFGDETIRHYELGARASAAMGHVELSATAFRTEYHDYQDAVFVLAQFAVGNAERVDLTGFELAGRAAIGERTRVDLSASFADLKYARHTAGMCYPGRTPDGSLPLSCDLSGERPLNAPPWELQLGLEHEKPVSWGTISGRLDWSWTDRYHTAFSADPRLMQGAHHDVGARIGARIGDTYEITLWGRNLLNENVVQITGLLNFFNDASWQSFFDEPRSYGLTLSARF
ncbi:MAG TPA: TonB-dependent receptor [Steroidobacteraceae bacterium]|nr:TonB-dependent receptor [Steroidobacteraceae bacterium]